MGFVLGKVKRKSATNTQTKKIKIKWVKKKQSRRVDNWMKVMFSNESRICISKGVKAGTLIWSKKTYKSVCLGFMAYQH